MPIPAEILAVERPKNTRVKKNGNKYDVIKRTCVRVNGKNVPKELGKIGEIVDGKYIPAKSSRLDFSLCDIKSFGRCEMAYMVSNNLFDELCKIYNVDDAKRIYVISLLRSAYGGITNGDLKFRYETSYISERYKGIHIFPASVSKFLDLLGRNYNKIKLFMVNRINSLDVKSKIIVDGMLKDCNCDTSDFSKWSRKTRLKGSEDISILYAFDNLSGEPVAQRVYSGNTLDSTSFDDFIEHFNLNNCLIMGDKGMINPDNFKKLNDTNRNLKYLFPLKRNDSKVDKYKMLDFDTTIQVDNDVLLAKKGVTEDGLFLYTFKSTDDEMKEKIGYLSNTIKNDSFELEKLQKKEKKFGIITFISNQDLELKEIYKMYESRWEIETFFNFYKNVAGLEDVRVQDNTSIIGSEFINFLSSIISIRIKKEFIKANLYDKYSYNQIMDKLGLIDKYFDSSKNKWITTGKIKYVNDIATSLKLDI